MFSFFKNQFVPSEQVFLHVSDLAIQRGYGIFEFFKVRKGKPLFIDDYLDRFYGSAEIMRLQVPHKPDALKEIVKELLQRNNATECGIKFILTGGYSSDAYTISNSNFIVSPYPLQLSDSISSGIKIITHEHVRELPQVKSINYITGIYTLKRMEEQAAADVLYHQNGMVSEFPRCNFFIVMKDGTVKTPGKNVLRGITRKNILKIASQQFKVEEGDVTLEEVYGAKEAFLTSTTKRIIPITQVEDTVIGDGQAGFVSKNLYNELVKLEDKYLSEA
jgi:branched-chain amino acid aminotransferase